MGKNVATTNSTIQLTDSSILATLVMNYTTGKAKANGSSIILQGTTVTVTAITTATATIADPGPYTLTISAGSTKVKGSSNKVILENDKSDSKVATPYTPATPNPIPAPVTLQVEVISAGQTKVKAL